MSKLGGATSAFTRKKWQKRFFVLQECKLRYWKAQEDYTKKPTSLKDATYDVRCDDDGAICTSVPRERVRALLPPNVRRDLGVDAPAASEQQKKLRAGDRVEILADPAADMKNCLVIPRARDVFRKHAQAINAKGGKGWANALGQIFEIMQDTAGDDELSVHEIVDYLRSNGLYDVRYDDGVEERGVLPRFVYPLDGEGAARKPPGGLPGEGGSSSSGIRRQDDAAAGLGFPFPPRRDDDTDIEWDKVCTHALRLVARGLVQAVPPRLRPSPSPRRRRRRKWTSISSIKRRMMSDVRVHRRCPPNFEV